MLNNAIGGIKETFTEISNHTLLSTMYINVLKVSAKFSENGIALLHIYIPSAKNLLSAHYAGIIPIYIGTPTYEYQQDILLNACGKRLDNEISARLTSNSDGVLIALKSSIDFEQAANIQISLKKII